MPKCYWNARWLEHEDFKSWIAQDPKDECSAYCKLCKKSFSLSSMGAQALRSHARGKLHQDLVNRPKSSASIATLFGMPPKRSEAANGHAATTTQPSVDKYLDGKETLRREVIWTLKVIKSHYSYHSCEDFIQTLKMMFPNNPDISKMTLGETKCHYLSVFGIAPHFEQLLREAVRKGKTYVLLFDETLNAELQKKQLDIHVRFWDGRKISTRYLTSVFMGHATAADLLDRILPVCQELCPDGLLQLSMDGPNVNWSLYKKLAEALSKHRETQLLNVGSCGLHIVHNAFRAGAEASGWELEDFLATLYWFFKDSPARRADFIDATGSDQFPLKFCRHRWLENLPVAERAVQLIPLLKVFFKALESGKYTVPQNTTFKKLRTALKDPLLVVKLNIFMALAQTLQPFLCKYQTDEPMLPFLAKDMLQLVKNLLGRVMKQEELDKLTSVRRLHSLSLDEDIFVETAKYDLGVLAKKEMTACRASSSEKQRFVVRQELKAFILATVKKILNKSPTNYPLTAELAALDPVIFLSGSRTSIDKITNLVSLVNTARLVPDSECEVIINQYRTARELALEKGWEFCPGARLDDFWAGLLETSDLKELWGLFKQLLLLSHGQASVERGFSDNAAISTTNLKGHTLVAQRQICDHIKQVGGLEHVQISDALLASVGRARGRYQAHLDEERAQKAATQVDKEKKQMEERIEEIKGKVRREELSKAALQKSADEYADQAEKSGDLTLLSKSNALRRTAKEKEGLIAQLKNQLQQLEIQV